MSGRAARDDGSVPGQMSSWLSEPDCSEFVLRVFEFIDEEIGRDERARIAAHLEDCAACLDEYERDVVLKALVRRSCGCEPAPGTLRTRIMARITTVRAPYGEYHQGLQETETVETTQIVEQGHRRAEIVEHTQIRTEVVPQWDRPAT